MKQQLFGDRQYITVTSISASLLALSLRFLLWYSLGSSPHRSLPSHCLTEEEWQPFVLLLMWVKACMLVLEYMFVRGIRTAVSACVQAHTFAVPLVRTSFKHYISPQGHMNKGSVDLTWCIERKTHIHKEHLSDNLSWIICMPVCLSRYAVLYLLFYRFLFFPHFTKRACFNF